MRFRVRVGVLLFAFCILDLMVEEIVYASFTYPA